MLLIVYLDDSKLLMCNRDPSPGLSLHKWVTEAGFENITEVKYKLPIGPWPKDKHLVSATLFSSMELGEG